MDGFSVELTKYAAADLDELSGEIRSKILDEISLPAADPFPRGKLKKRLKGFKFRLYRLRSGDYRVLYRIDAGVVTVMRVIARKDLEKIAKRLKC